MNNATSPLDRKSLWRIDAAGVTVCALLSIALYYAGLQPLVSGYDTFVDEQQQLELKQQSATTSSASLQTAQRRVGALRQQLADSPLQLEPATSINKRLAGITALAGELNLRMEDMQPGKSSSLSRFETVPLHLAGTGTYRTCLLFLHKLRQAFPDTAVTNLHLTANPNDPTGAATFKFDLEWFTALPETPTSK